ncbi:MAG: cation:proton antiporter [Hyphomicrobiales bacterium]|nr:cation:proton antiporter [Hyphomicrobiales bacterium]
MAEHANELTGIAIVMTLAVLLGLLFVKLRQPAIVGYILTGMVLGPTGLGLVSGTGSITFLAELGVIMLLFLVGMELSLRAFLKVIWPAAITAAGQIAVSFIFTFGFGALFGWPTQLAVLLGFIVALSSTAVVMKMLEEIGELRTQTGRITVGVMIAQDIAIVPMLLLVDSFGNESAEWSTIVTKLVLAIAGLAVLIRFLAKGGKFTLPFTEAIRGRNDVIALAIVAFCFGAAAMSGAFGLSTAYGAFVGGLVISSSTLRAEAIHATHPIQSVLMVVFFLSIGLLIDLNYVVDNIVQVLLFVIGVIVVKTIVNIALLRLVGETWERAFPGGLIMAQIGEFSFVLAAVGWKGGAISGDGYRLAIAVIALSLLVSPLWMIMVRHVHDTALTGITDLRTALAEVYAPERYGLERQAHFMKVLPYLIRRRSRPILSSWRRVRAERAISRHLQNTGADIVASPFATAEGYPPEDEERNIHRPPKRSGRGGLRRRRTGQRKDDLV